MATSFDNIIELMMTNIRDYKIDSLYEIDPTGFATYLDGFILRGLPRFTDSLTSLDYNAETREFTHDLSLLEQTIIADYATLEWMKSCIEDITQFQLHLTNREFKIHSEAENLKQKQSLANDMREKVKQLSVDYQLVNFNRITELSK